MNEQIDFQTDVSKYRHWHIEYQDEIAHLYMDVDEEGGMFDGYELKLNSYDLGVDIELADIVQRMRFEHPEVKVVVMRTGKANVFCAGANIRMLGQATHVHKVNFCKFTNETRNTFEAAAEESGQQYIAVIKGACAGGGYELALACNYIMLINDSISSVSLPEIPLLAVLPGTGGLTRLTDKRRVRRDHADLFCLTEEGVKGQRAKQWNLVDELVPNARFEQIVQERSKEFASKISDKGAKQGIKLNPLDKTIAAEGSIKYSSLEILIDRNAHVATISISGPKSDAPTSMEEFLAQGCDAYLLRLARELDDAILHLRLNETELGLLIFRTQGDSAQLAAHEAFLTQNIDHWLTNEVIMLWKRVLKRLDVTSRSLMALVEHGSCFVGVLAEILFAVDRSYMMEDEFEGDDRALAAILLTDINFGPLPMANKLTRLETRFWGDPQKVAEAKYYKGRLLVAEDADQLGLVTMILDDIDWEDEIRIVVEERSSFSPDAVTAMEANLRFAGPETMETRIFGRLSAWQNWIFQRPNAVGETGALQRYGTGRRSVYSLERV